MKHPTKTNYKNWLLSKKDYKINNLYLIDGKIYKFTPLGFSFVNYEYNKQYYKDITKLL